MLNYIPLEILAVVTFLFMFGYGVGRYKESKTDSKEDILIQEEIAELYKMKMELEIEVAEMRSKYAEACTEQSVSYQKGWEAGRAEGRAEYKKKRDLEEELRQADEELKEAKARNERKRKERDERENKYSRSHFEFHPNGERNHRYDGNCQGKGRSSAHSQSNEEAFRDFRRRRSSFEDFRSNFHCDGSWFDEAPKSESRSKHTYETEKMMKRFGITELTRANVKKAHRRLAKSYHPDRNQNNNANSMMQEVNEIRSKLLKLCRS